MKKENDIYTLCNAIQSDIDSYDIAPMNDFEKKRMQHMAAQIAANYPKQQRKVKPSRKWIVVACSTLLVCGVMLTDMGSSAVYAAGESIAYHISSFLGIDRNLSDYAAVIGSEQTDKGYSIRLNEVILNQNTLLVSTNVYKVDDEGNAIEEVPMALTLGDVYINGRDATNMAIGTEAYDEAGNYLGILSEYHLKDGIDTTKELDIKLVFQNIKFEQERLSGNWEFHFTVDGKTLAGDTVNIPLNYIVKSDNDASVTFSHYSSNVLGERIYYSIEGNLNKNIYLNGVDNLGNEVQFISHVYEGNYAGTEGKGYMMPIRADMIIEGTKSITLTPFVSTDVVKDNRHFRGELIQAGEAFTIELQ